MDTAVPVINTQYKNGIANESCGRDLYIWTGMNLTDQRLIGTEPDYRE